MNNYKAFVNGEQAQIYSANIYEPPYNEYRRMPYISFCCEENAAVVLYSEEKIEDCIIRPISCNAEYTYTEHEITINMKKPLKLSVEINGTHKNNILVFANPKTECPEGDRVIRFERGVTDAGIVDICEDNTTVFFEEGAYVEGKINIHDCENVKICGAGILSMEKYPRNFRDGFKNAILVKNCRNIELADFAIVDSVAWSCTIMGCDGVHINNVKIIGSRGNSDGFDICGSRDVLVENVFTRTWDDSFVLKALDTGNVDNVVFRDSVLWNDFARPMEVGVEVRADYARNILFENIDVIHSLTGYPIMGIHHGDRAVISDVEFKNIRIEDAPGAQLFDIRITNSVWNKDDKMGRIENIKFTDIYLAEEQETLPSRSRIQGFSKENNISGVVFENINFLGKFARNTEECQLNVMDFVDDVRFVYPKNSEYIELIDTRPEIIEPFKLCPKCGKYKGKIRLNVQNNTDAEEAVDAYLKISPKNAAEFTPARLIKTLAPGQSAFVDYDVVLPAGKYVAEVQSGNVNINNTWMLIQLDLVLDKSIDAANEYFISDWYGNVSSGIRLAAAEDKLYIKSDYEKLKLYTAMPVPLAAGEVMFSVEETDFGEVSAVLNGLHGAELAPQLRCPAEITYVFENEPKVKEIVVTETAGCAQIPFEQLGIEPGCKGFWLEVEAEIPEVSGHRYPFTMFRSVAPGKMAHMFARVVVK